MIYMIIDVLIKEKKHRLTYITKIPNEKLRSDAVDLES